MSHNGTEPIPVQVVNHPEPKRYERRASFLTVQLTATAPYAQLAGYDPLRDHIRISGVTAAIILAGSLAQVQSAVNASTAIGSRPDGRLIPATTLESITEGQNEVWVTTGSNNLPLNIGYEIIRKVPES